MLLFESALFNFSDLFVTINETISAFPRLFRAIYFVYLILIPARWHK